MPYYSVSLFPKDEELSPNNWGNLIEIGELIPSRVETIEKWNFNRYNGRLEVRFDIPEKEKEEIREVVSQMDEKGEIKDYDFGDWKIWGAPKFVQIAHETATQCAVSFKEQVDNFKTIEELMSIGELKNNRAKVFSFFYILRGNIPLPLIG